MGVKAGLQAFHTQKRIGQVCILIMWNCLMKMAIGLFGIQERPFRGFLTFKLPKEITPIRSKLIIARQVFQKNMLQHGFEYAAAWSYPIPEYALKRYSSMF
jgi:hypothetical protein